MPLPRLIATLGKVTVKTLLAVAAGVALFFVWLTACGLSAGASSTMADQSDSEDRHYAWIPLAMIGFFIALFAAICVLARRRRWKAGRFFAWQLVVGALTGAVGLLLFFSRTSDALDYFPGLPWLTLAVQATAVAGLVAFARWSLWTPGRMLLLSLFLLTPLVSWLSLDEPKVLQPCRLSDVIPSSARNPALRELALAYTPHDGKPPQRRFSWPRFLPGLPPRAIANWGPYVEKLSSQRTELQAGWSSLAEARAWVDELNQQAQISDLPATGPQDWNAPRLALNPVDTVVNLGCAEALILARDGHGDEAIAHLVPLLAVARKLDETAVQIPRYMVARRQIQLVTSTARYVLRHATVSPAARSALAAACGTEEPDLPGLHRYFDAYHANMYESVLGAGAVGGLFGEGPVNFWRLFYNPHATANEFAAFMEESKQLAERRDLVALDRAEQYFRRGRLKNFGGQMVLYSVTPQVMRIAQRFWESEDERRALARELRGG